MPAYFYKFTLMAFSVLFLTITPLSAQETDFQLGAQEQKLSESEEAINTLQSLLDSVSEQKKEIKELKKQLRAAKEDASKKELEEAIKTANEKLAGTESQISSLSTGVSSEEMNTGPQKFDLQSELEGLAQPFIQMMKDATATARQVDKLKSTAANAQVQTNLADRALKRLEELKQAGGELGNLSKSTNKHLQNQIKDWQGRLEESKNAKEAAEQQLAVHLEETNKNSKSIGEYASDFLKERGYNLLLGLSAFAGVMIFMNLLSRLVGWFWQRMGWKRTFFVRLIRLVFWLLTFTFSFMAMLFVFNLMNDWLLLGLGAIFAIALTWIGITMLPGMIEQITMLLNLGAVQEGERIMFNGVPWEVQRLDIYTDLVNPALDGGTFTLPIRELIGLHSRPSANDESWFPTFKEDWVMLGEDQAGQVISQTPELVQIREIGGSHVTYETSAFLGESLRNLSPGFRIQQEIGLDYVHQFEATTEIPKKLKMFVEQKLTNKFGLDSVESVEVDLLRTDDSAIVFEVEAEFSGKQAHLYEDIEKEIATFIVEACNKYQWQIPFPQMVIRKV